MTTTGRTHWLAKDCGWWRRSRIIKLGLEFGAEGPAVIDWLSCEAKAQNDGGWVKTGYLSLERGCFVAEDRARHVVSQAVTLGVLDDYEEDGDVFICRISGWKTDQEKAHAADRQADYRARKAAKSDETSTSSNGLSHPVTDCPPTGQDRTEQNSPLDPPQAGDTAPKKPLGKRGRDLDAYWQQINTWAAQHFPGCHPNGIASIVGAVHAEGRTATPQTVREFAETHPNFAHLLEREEAAA